MEKVKHPDEILVQLDNQLSVFCDGQSSGWARALERGKHLMLLVCPTVLLYLEVPSLNFDQFFQR